MAHIKILAVAATFLAFSSPCGASEQWLNPLPPSLGAATRVELPRTSYVEIPVSMLDAAVAQPSQESAVALEDDGPGNYRRSDLVCAEGTTPFLVRAVYANGATGGYYLARSGDALLVSHASLGVSNGAHRSALLACLPFRPIEVYISTSGAM